MYVITAEQIKAEQVIAMESDGELFDMSLPLDEQWVGWDPAIIQSVHHYPATSTLDVVLLGGYRHRMSMGQEVFVL